MDDHHKFKKTILFFPTSLLALLLLLLLAYNGVSIFCIRLPFPGKTSPETAKFPPENVAGEVARKWSSSSSVMYAVKEENPRSMPTTRLPLLEKSDFSVLQASNSESIASTHLPDLSNSGHSDLGFDNSQALETTHLPILENSGHSDLGFDNSESLEATRLPILENSGFVVLQTSNSDSIASTNLSNSGHSDPGFVNSQALETTHLPILENSGYSSIRRTRRKRSRRIKVSSATRLPISRNSDYLSPKRLRKLKILSKMTNSESNSSRFSSRVSEFFHGFSSNSSNCKYRFFMTWISSLDSFGYRELFTIESLFKSHPYACLLIVSNSMDSKRGSQLLKPFLDYGFRVTAISPDFDYIFKNTLAESWFDRLKRGNVDPGEVPLGQNLSNLIRLALLYKYGGIYLDTDVIVLRSFSSLRNTIGAQTIDLESGKWSRLNNAVMIFDKKHPLLLKFIEEFALTFNGNKWGHNGPYLVSRVVSRVSGRSGFDNFKVLAPSAFYPVDWSRIGGFFHGPRNDSHSKWLVGKLREIRTRGFAVHLWNRQSRKLIVEEGSIIDHIMLDCCIFCNSVAATMNL